jgi:hypothetical protein
MDVEPDDVEPNQPDNDATNGSPWTLDEPFPSSWVVFWPHQEAPTREEIGSYLGLKLETVSRTFSKFMEDGIVEVKQKNLHIRDPDALKLIVNAAHCE